MNDINIIQFIRETEEYLRRNQSVLTQGEHDSITELYEDLNLELSRQEMAEDLYL